MGLEDIVAAAAALIAHSKGKMDLADDQVEYLKRYVRNNYHSLSYEDKQRLEYVFNE